MVDNAGITSEFHELLVKLNLDDTDIESYILDVGNKLDLDVEIIEYLIRDLIFSKRFLIVGLGDDYDQSILWEIYQHLREYYDVKIVNDKDDFPHDISSDDCILVISNSGEDGETIELIRYAKSKRVYVYVMSSDARSTLALLCDKFIHIKDSQIFKENSTLFLYAFILRIYYHMGYVEYKLNTPQPANIRESRRIDAIVEPEEDSHFQKIRNSHRKIRFILFFWGLIIFLPTLIGLWGFFTNIAGVNIYYVIGFLIVGTISVHFMSKLFY